MNRPKRIEKYDLLPPGGQWMRWRFPSRAERRRNHVATAIVLAVSLAIWAMMVVAVLRWLRWLRWL